MNIKLLGYLSLALVASTTLMVYKSVNAQEATQPSVIAKTPRSNNRVLHCNGCRVYITKNVDDELLIEPSRYWRGSLPVPEGSIWVPAVYPRSKVTFQVRRDEDFEDRCARNYKDNMEVASANYRYHSVSGACPCGQDHSSGQGPTGGSGNGAEARKSREEGQLRNLLVSADQTSAESRKRAAKAEVQQLREDFKNLKNIDIIKLQDSEEYIRFIESRTSNKKKEYDIVQRWVCENCAQTDRGGTKKNPKKPGKTNGCLMADSHSWSKL